MPAPVTTLLARLNVGRKLALIYLLDLSAVIFISGILIHEKFIAIDFARSELAGNAYVMAIRAPLLAVRHGAAARDRLGAGVRAAEARYGTDFGSADLATAFVASLATPSAAAADADVIARGRALVTRIGNKSNLILDPDLDSYYTMSLVLLRYPELVEVSHDITTSMTALAGSRRPPTADVRTRYFLLEGRLDAVAKAIASDFDEAFAGASDPRLHDALEPLRVQLLADVDRYREAARATLADDADAAGSAALKQADDALGDRLDAVWARSSEELTRLLDARIDGFFHKMWLHLGTTLSLLCLILFAVFTVARHITGPLRRLAGVAETVARTGDGGERAVRESNDEIGKLVTRFNDMLDQLAVVRSSEKELAGRARAAIAQRELVEAVPVPMVVTAIPTHEVLHANAPAQAWLDGKVDDPWADGLESAARGRFFQRLADEGFVDEFEVRWHGSAARWAVLSARRLTYQGREAVVTTFTPINRQKSLEQRLGLWAKVFESSSESILIVDAERRVVSVNRAFLRSTGHDVRDVVGESTDRLLDEYDDVSFDVCCRAAEARGGWQGEVRIQRSDGSTFPAWMVVSAVRDGAGPLTHYICASLDISERKAAEERIRFLAHHDVLTALPNRALCLERLRTAIDEAARDGGRVAVLFMDLDHFKTINDSLGHHVGDGLLRSVARRLLDAVRVGDTVSRLGGDEFVIVLRGVVDGDEALATVENRLVPAIRRPHRVAGSELQVSCSIGIALFPDDGADVDDVMRHADAAMYQAKRLGRDAAQRFSSELDERAQRRMQLQSHLRHALERNELSLVYQPKMKAATRACVGVEALLRWHASGLGDIEPAELIPLAEESRLITPIGAWVIDEAIRQHATWRREGLGDIPVSVNVSAVQFRDGDVVATVRRALWLHGVPAAALEIELTESTLMDGLDGTQGQLRALRALGVTVSVDDFGTGYASLTYLNRFPIDRIKIDRSFVRDVLVDPADMAITRAIIGLGHTLGLTVIAEGVESEAVAEALGDAHCDELQGFLFAVPMTPGALSAWWRAWRASGPRLRLVAADAA